MREKFKNTDSEVCLQALNDASNSSHSGCYTFLFSINTSFFSLAFRLSFLFLSLPQTDFFISNFPILFLSLHIYPHDAILTQATPPLVPSATTLVFPPPRPQCHTSHHPTPIPLTPSTTFPAPSTSLIPTFLFYLTGPLNPSAVASLSCVFINSVGGKSTPFFSSLSVHTQFFPYLLAVVLLAWDGVF